MDFIKDMLIRNGILTSGGYIDDALVTNRACVRDSHGWITHRLERAANGVDIIAVNASTGRVDCRICL